jgi:hypothetical protein
MYDTRYPRDDLIPFLRDDGISDNLAHWLGKNASQEFLIELIQMEHSVILLTAQLRQVIADLCEIGELDGASIEGLPLPVIRPSAPAGIGCSGGNVWVSPSGEVYTLRFYRNGEHKLSMENYYITDLATLGAVAGDIVQVCQVTEGVPGWWARILVS